jgi:hypothetical protein
MKNLQRHTTVAAITMLFLFAGTITAQSKKQQDLVPFTIDININSSQATLKCTSGCGWKTLSFSTDTGAAQWIDANGKTQETSVTTIDEKLAPFKISVQQIGAEILVKSTKGTVWKELSLKMNKGFTMQINEFAMIQ